MTVHTLRHQRALRYYSRMQAQADAEAAAHEMERAAELDAQLQADARRDRESMESPRGFVGFFHAELGPYWYAWLVLACFVFGVLLALCVPPVVRALIELLTGAVA